MAAKEERNFWHPGFVGAMGLELRDYKAGLVFEEERMLGRMPPRADLLVIKKDSGVTVNNQIGELFRGHNVVEYKSPGDALNMDVLYKTLGYACLYKGLGKHVNEVPAAELTVTLLRAGRPRRMFGMLREGGAGVERRHPGVYDVSGVINFPVQVVVTRELEAGAHPALRVLARDVAADDVTAFVRMAGELTEPGDRHNADAVLQLSVSANRRLYEEMKRRDPAMSEALRELMRDEIEAEKKQAAEQAAEQAAKQATERAAEQAAEQIDSTLVSIVRNQMDAFGLGADKILASMGIPPAEQARYAAML